MSFISAAMLFQEFLDGLVDFSLNLLENMKESYMIDFLLTWQKLLGKFIRVFKKRQGSSVDCILKNQKILQGYQKLIESKLFFDEKELKLTYFSIKSFNGLISSENIYKESTFLNFSQKIMSRILEILMEFVQEKVTYISLHFY